MPQSLQPFDLASLLQHGEYLLGNDTDSDDIYPAPTDASEVLDGMVTVYAMDNRDAIPDALIECGGMKFKQHGAQAMYRLLWAMKPSAVDFSDMYGAFLCFAVTKCGRFGVKVWLHKYEPSLTFYCLSDDIEGALSAIQSGIPSISNGLTCTSDLGKRFFAYIQRIGETPHEIYSGNDFTV